MVAIPLPPSWRSRAAEIPPTPPTPVALESPPSRLSNASGLRLLPRLKALSARTAVATDRNRRSASDGGSIAVLLASREGGLFSRVRLLDLPCRLPGVDVLLRMSLACRMKAGVEGVRCTVEEELVADPRVPNRLLFFLTIAAFLLLITIPLSIRMPTGSLLVPASSRLGSMRLISSLASASCFCVAWRWKTRTMASWTKNTSK
mmetsp:Transcript_21976/g.62612  ORF Transcript_21976/g.62612 Transcript_21976/m.62612 type:complete len:204 (-) Transcript_21976:1124-1735(-)